MHLKKLRTPSNSEYTFLTLSRRNMCAQSCCYTVMIKRQISTDMNIEMLMKKYRNNMRLFLAADFCSLLKTSTLERCLGFVSITILPQSLFYKDTSHFSVHDNGLKGRSDLPELHAAWAALLSHMQVKSQRGWLHISKARASPTCMGSCTRQRIRENSKRRAIQSACIS